MAKARLMDQPEDFKKLGIDPTKVQEWEDGRRDTDAPGTSEVWYFDAILDDGSKAVIYFHPKSPYKLREKGDYPDIGIYITAPDGKMYGQQIIEYPAEESSFGAEKCDVKVGPHSVVGNFKDYDIHIDPVAKVAADLHFHALVKPFRQGNSAVITLGDNDEYHYTDLNVTKNAVTGTLTYNGETHEVTGLGYHDHQWLNISPIVAWHHWLWGHLYTENYTVLIYDFVAAAQFDFKAIPFFGVMDNKTGEVIFQTDGNFDRKTELETQKDIKKAFPKKSEYTFKNKDGQTVKFTTEWKQELEIRDMYWKAPAEVKERYDKMGIQPGYMRYYADGTLSFEKDGQTVTESGDMIYEYNYGGKEDPRAHV
ncbi:lipocalin-like domain-containing protein [Ligilactobacillus acidipiscis]|uniref:lipocalin-like domain-containing protein n=1 Tax=Ligilactobacillus acidipiscis TaxID=89059 RepID=UPI0022E901BD|nr:lipocalin-like domain-containing protein [Ligilactobacillus acidipiscis]